MWKTDNGSYRNATVQAIYCEGDIAGPNADAKNTELGRKIELLCNFVSREFRLENGVVNSGLDISNRE